MPTSEKNNSEKTNKENSYRNILKATSIFGGVQMFHILISILRGKLVAMILGPAGMGVSSLYVSSTNSLVQLSGLGLNMAIVKETGASREDDGRVKRVVGTVRRLTLLTALFGALLCMGLSFWLSEFSFGDSSHTLSFIALGMMVFFTVAYGGEMSVLQGLRDVKRLSRATVWGSGCGLIISIPLYYFFGTDGIVPAMILLSLCVYLFYLFSSRKRISSDGAFLLRRDEWPLVRKLLVLGLMLTSGNILRTLAIYAIQAYVRYAGDIADVGLYQGVNSMTAQYSGVVLSALGMDFFPRISKMVSDRAGMEQAINRQLEIICYLAAVVAGTVIVAAPFVIRILLTSEFLSTVSLLQWLALSVVLQAILFPMAYVPYVKEDKKVYFWVEVVGSNIMILLLSLGAYSLWGLDGLGYAAVADNLFWAVVAAVINSRLYRLDLDRKAVRAICLSLTICGTLLLLAYFQYSAVVLSIMICILLSGYALFIHNLRHWLSRRKSS